MANQSVLRHLPGKNDLVLADRLIHHSIAQTLATSPVKFKRYRHLDLNHLEELLSDHHSNYVYQKTIHSEYANTIINKH